MYLMGQAVFPGRRQIAVQSVDDRGSESPHAMEVHR